MWKSGQIFSSHLIHCLLLSHINSPIFSGGYISTFSIYFPHFFESLSIYATISYCSFICFLSFKDFYFAPNTTAFFISFFLPFQFEYSLYLSLLGGKSLQSKRGNNKARSSLKSATPWLTVRPIFAPFFSI